MKLGILLAGAVLSFSSAFGAEPQPEPQPRTQIERLVRSLEGKIVYCRGERDVDVRGFRFDDWIAFVNQSQPAPYISIHFVPRFLRCQRLATRTGAFYRWDEDAVYRAENRLAAGIYERGWLGSERIQFMDRAEFPELDAADSRLYLRYPLKTFFSEKEWKILREKKQLEKSGIFFPWPKARWDTPDGGIPSDIFMHASWYDLKLTFAMSESQAVSVSRVSAVYQQR